MNTMEHRASRWALLVVTAAVLAACGGGSSDEDSNGDGAGNGDAGGGANPPVIVKSVTDLQGRWTDTVTEPNAYAFVLADGKAWVLQVDNADSPVAVIKGQWRVVGDVYTGTARRVNVDGKADDVSMSVSNLASGATMSGDLNSLNFSWVGAGVEVPLSLTTMAGTWKGNVDAARATVTWTLTATGALTGNSTTGCDYAGSLNAGTGIAAVSLSVTETCAGVVKALSGIGTLDTTGSRASFPYIADDESGAGVFRLTKQ